VHIGGLEVEVPKHRVGLPPANQLYKERVDSRAEQRHSPSGPEGPGGDLTGLKAQFRHETARTPEHGGKSIAGDLGGNASRKEHGVKRSVRRGVMFSQMADSAEDGMYWRHEDLVRRAMGELFAAFSILLLGKREVNLVG
jgi:hypothetical protein